MSSVQLVHRLFSIESGVDSEKIVKGTLDEDEWSQLMEKVQVLNTNKLIIDDTPQLSIFDLRAKCRRLKHRYDIDLVIVDYLQLMQGNSDERGRNGNREQEISMISRQLKALSKELNIPVLAMSQLSRQVENRVGNKPQLSDLRESGAIEQDADIVMFIYRAEYYGIQTYPNDGSPTAGMADIIVAKHRSGSTGEVRMNFVSKFARFENPPVDTGMGAASAGAGMIPNSNFDNGGSVIIDSKMNEDQNLNPDGDVPF